MDPQQNVAARYLYGPFGRLVGKWGPLAEANAMQFSSMPRHLNSGLSLYTFRAYDSTLQRWLTRDRAGELGGLNLYGFVGDNPINFVDPLGLDVWIEGPSGAEPTGHLSINVGDPLGQYSSFSFGITGLSPIGHVYEDEELGGAIKKYAKTTPEQDAAILEDLKAELAAKDGTFYGIYNCRSFSKNKFDQYKTGFGLKETTPPTRTPAPRAWYRNPLSSTTTLGSGSTLPSSRILGTSGASSTRASTAP
jgi:RHS repeat-associated protein